MNTCEHRVVAKTHAEPEFEKKDEEAWTCTSCGFTADAASWSVISEPSDRPREFVGGEPMWRESKTQRFVDVVRSPETPACRPESAQSLCQPKRSLLLVTADYRNTKDRSSLVGSRRFCHLGATSSVLRRGRHGQASNQRFPRSNAVSERQGTVEYGLIRSAP